MSLNFFSIPEKRLAASILATDSSFKVSNIKGWDGDDLESGDFGSLHFVAFRNSTGTQIEFMEIDPTTIADTSITINKRGLQLNATDLTTEVTANKFLWVKGDTIVSFGTNPPQLYQWLKEYIDGIAIAGSPDASTIAKGLVEEATQAELRARTGVGSTSARLAVNPSTLPNVLIADYVASDTGSADAYAIAPTPAIVAYVAGQIFTFKAANANTATSTLDVNGFGVKTIKKAGGATNLDANDIRASQIVQVQYDGTNFQMISPVGHDLATSAELATDLAAAVKFGGDGSDGALVITTGTTTIDLSGAQIVVKNYTSISITGDGKLAFSNPHANGSTIILKSQGAVTLISSSSSMIDAIGIGAAGGAAGAIDGNGSPGTISVGMWFPTPDFGDGAGSSTGGGSGAGGAAPTSAEADPWTTGSGNSYKINRKAIFLTPGSGAGGGAGAVDNDASTNEGAGGAGGRGGGVVYIECGGAWNFTTGSIDVSGQAGTAAAAVAANEANNSTAAGGGGGGGSAGMFLALYNTLTANSGTIITKGGVGGAGGSTTGNGGNNGDPDSGAGGGGAAGYGAAGGAGANGVNPSSTTNSNGAAGSAGNLGSGGGGGSGAAADAGGSHVASGGGGGAAGTGVTSLVIQNTVFA